MTSLPSHAGEPGSARRAWFAALLVLAVAAAFRLFAVHEDMLYDPLAYAQYAYNLVEGTYSLTDDYAFAHRLTVIAPLAVSYATLGVGEYSNLLWLHLVSLVQVLAVMWLGARLVSPAAGILAGLLLALAPLDVLYSNFLTPDVVMAGFLTCSAALWIVGNERGGARAGAFLFLSGVCLALAVWTRMYSALLGVFFAGYLVWRRPPWKHVAWTALGGIAVFAGLALLYWREAGDPLHFLTVQSSSFGNQVNPRGPQWGYYFWHLLHPRSQAGLLGPLWLLGLGVALVRPNRVRSLLLLWTLPFFLYLQFGSMSLTSFQPVWKTIRYLTPLFAPCCLLVALLLLGFVRAPNLPVIGRWRAFATPEARRRWVAALLVAVAVQSVGIVAADRDRHRRIADEFESAALVLEEEPSLPILFDHWRTGIAFAYYFDYREGAQFYRNAADSLRIGRPGAFGDSRFGYLPWYERAQEVPEALVVLDDQVWSLAGEDGDLAGSYLGVQLPMFAAAPPADWQLVHSGSRIRVYRVHAAADTSHTGTTSLAGPGDKR